jgi:hypothetical protein
MMRIIAIIGFAALVCACAATRPQQTDPLIGKTFWVAPDAPHGVSLCDDDILIKNCVSIEKGKFTVQASAISV